jgi:hypothetical protein
MGAMSRRSLGISILLLTCIALPTVAVSPGSSGGNSDSPTESRKCTVLTWDRASWAYPSMFIREPGKYCLDRDYTADLRWCSHGCRGEFIDIRSNDVELDLGGHTLRALLKPNTHNYSGILAIGNNIVIRNGRIRGGGAGVTFRAVPPDPMPAGAWSPDPSEITHEQLEVPLIVYGAGGLRIENMIIEDTGYPIRAAGANVIAIGNQVTSSLVPDPVVALVAKNPWLPRRFTETSPAGAISIYGPGAVVEGNTIEQTNRTGGKLVAYSILLRDAKGGVVRNNRIRNSGSSEKTIGIGLKDSTDVVIQGNTLLNIETPVAVIGTGSTFVQQR